MSETLMVYTNVGLICVCGWQMYPHHRNWSSPDQKFRVSCVNQECEHFQKDWDVEPSIRLLRRVENDK